MHRPRRIFVLAGVAVVVLALLVWRLGVASSDQETPDQETPPRPTAPAASEEGDTSPPAARSQGRKVWFGPAPGAETGLPRGKGPLPETIRLDQVYPRLRPGDVRRAVMVMGVVDDTSTLTRLLVLDESWQVFELGLVSLGRVTGGPPISHGALSPNGTRVAFGHTRSYLVVNLRDLRRRWIGVAGASSRDLSWSGGSVVLGDGPRARRERSSSRTAETVVTQGIDGVPTRSDRPRAVVVRGSAPALLVLDGPRLTACCKVAGWTDRRHVLVESIVGDQLHLLDWDTVDGTVALVSTIEPAVSNDWYLVTSYPDLQR